MQKYHFSLNISYSDFLAYYEQAAQYVKVEGFCGKELRIHARHFIPYLTYTGIQGLFEMTLDDKGSLITLSRYS